MVLVNAMIPRPGETPGEWWTNTHHDEAKREQNLRDGRPADAFDLLIDFFHDVPKPVIDEAWAQGEPRQSNAIFASPCTIESWPAVPTRVLAGRDDRFFPVGFQRRVAGERLGIAADEMPGGHLVALSQPAELSARLLAYTARLQEQDIEGQGQVEYLMMYRGDGSASFVGLERFVGRLAGKAGTFVLQRTGAFESGQAKESYSVIPGSGTGELRGLRGDGTSAVGHGTEHPFVLSYEFD
jgi:hypothetical protein